jgi:hypothetical protein
VLPGFDHFFKRAVAGDRLASLRDARRTVSTRMIDRLVHWIGRMAT